MPSHAGTVPRFTCVLVALALVIAGCSQNSPPQDRAAQSASTRAKSSSGESQVSDQAEASDDSAVKVASAESTVQPKSASAEHLDTAEPQAPAKLPSAKAPLPLDNVDVADLEMPKVSLTEQHAATCKVGVGDAFPDLQLSDLRGDKQSLATLLGDKLTLVVFWNGTQPTALEELSDLARYHQPRFGDEGLSIVAVNTGDNPRLVDELAHQAGASFPVLSDADGAAYKQVATANIPRTYLLDPAGQVLWFDLEYSPTTRRDMVQAIRYSLAHR